MKRLSGRYGDGFYSPLGSFALLLDVVVVVVVAVVEETLMLVVLLPLLPELLLLLLELELEVLCVLLDLLWVEDLLWWL